MYIKRVGAHIHIRGGNLHQFDFSYVCEVNSTTDVFISETKTFNLLYSISSLYISLIHGIHISKFRMYQYYQGRIFTECFAFHEMMVEHVELGWRLPHHFKSSKLFNSSFLVCSKKCNRKTQAGTKIRSRHNSKH